ncbi:hypothetical protein PIB30_061819 [Stylosanthes scabra]|uniref:Uncharacterized protein n=1 Tax=Stylosanthes scabra TaxID=79078 RepID=A0ABU6YJL7_9FABA|nr:hypothetical protein [Stylosanthes scabra]
MVNPLVGTHLSNSRVNHDNHYTYKLAYSNDKEEEESEEEEKSEDEYEGDDSESEDEVDEERGGEVKDSDTDGQSDKGKVFFIITFFNDKKVEEEIPVKCEDPCPCLVTCKIRGVDIPGCLCDLGACGNIMPYELYDTLDLGPLKRTREVFTTADASIVSVAGIAKNVWSE